MPTKPKEPRSRRAAIPVTRRSGKSRADELDSGLALLVDIFKRKRRRRRMSVVSLAKRAQVPVRTIQRLESYRLNSVGLQDLLAIGTALGSKLTVELAPVRPKLPKTNAEILREFNALVKSPNCNPFVRNQPDKEHHDLCWDTARTFLVTAMANSAGGEIRACGLDAHRPDTFVPVSGVFYLRRSCSAVELEALLRGVWPLLTSAEAQILVLNGIWSRVPDIRTKIPELAKRHNVLIADDFGNAVPRLRDWVEMNASLVRVQSGDEQGGRLSVRVLGHARTLISEILDKVAPIHGAP